MADKLKEFLKKIHSSKNEIPEYISIFIRIGKDIIDLKIKKEESNNLKITAHEKEKKGWYLHSYHIMLKNLGLPEDAKNKKILPYLNNPTRIRRDTSTKELLEEIIGKYGEIRAERKKHYFRTERYKVKKEFQMGAKLKGF
ncbi:MAG: hypothetical protein BAJALOKI2v1_100050 [Promethearchaeota archaeon]|nr:MAG: hypothetical protein BAJALOKI2v1_100050 [Candidatus Lokiarchaeota archaeon]